MYDLTTLTAVDCYNTHRLPHYGDIEYTATIECVHLDDAAIEQYQTACQRFLDANGLDDDLDRHDFSVTIAVTMEVVESSEETIEVGETYTIDDFTVYPGELHWPRCPEAVQQCRRER